MKSFVSKLVFSSLLLTTLSTQPIFLNFLGVNPYQNTHPALRPGNTTHIAQSLPTYLQSGAVVGSAAFIGAFVRLYNKQHKTDHLSFFETLNPINFIPHPLQCIDDGLIGHIGAGNSQSYGIMGTGMAWVPKVDNTIITVDQTKRKVEAWLEWLNRNIAQINTARAGMASVAHHTKRKFEHAYDTLASYIQAA